MAAALRVLSHFGHVPGSAVSAVVASAEVGEGIGVRVNATHALVGVEPSVALPVLWRLLADASWEVRRAATDALVRLGARGVDVLRRAASAHQDRFARDVASMALATPAVAAGNGGDWSVRVPRSDSGRVPVDDEFEESRSGLRLARGPA